MATNLQFIKSASGSSVSSLDVTDCFSDKYDVYAIYVRAGKINSGNADMEARLLDNSNTVISTSTYDYAMQDLNIASAFTEQRGTNQSQLQNVGVSGTANGTDFTMYVFNPNNASYTFFTNQMGGIASTTNRGRKAIYVEKSTTQCKGIRFFYSSVTGNIDVSVYGVK